MKFPITIDESEFRTIALTAFGLGFCTAILLFMLFG